MTLGELLTVSTEFFKKHIRVYYKTNRYALNKVKAEWLNFEVKTLNCRRNVSNGNIEINVKIASEDTH